MPQSDEQENALAKRPESLDGQQVWLRDMLSEAIDGEQARLRDMLRREQARSDLLWELAIRRGLVSLEDETMHEGAQDRNGR